MADFTSSFWSWFIIVITVASFVGLVWFILALDKGRKKVKPGETVETMGHVWDGDLAEYNNPMPRWWLNLFYITLVFGAVYLILFPGLGSFPGLLGWTSLGKYERELAQAEEMYGPLFAQYQDQDIETLAQDPEAVRMGKRLYATYCVPCHGSDARGAPGYPNLTDGEWQWGGTPEAIHASIYDGRNAVMPPWEAILSEEQIFAVAEYVLSLSGRTADPVIAGQGREVYAQNCAACHGAEGKGMPMLGAPDLSNDVWLYGGSQRRIIESIAKGRQGVMPPHGEFLGEAKVHLLTAFVYSLSQPKAP